MDLSTWLIYDFTERKRRKWGASLGAGNAEQAVSLGSCVCGADDLAQDLPESVLKSRAWVHPLNGNLGEVAWNLGRDSMGFTFNKHVR